MQKVSVIGAGTMGNGIAHVFAQYGYSVHLIDINEAALQKGIATINKNLDRMVAKQKLTEAQKQETLNRITPSTDLQTGVANADLVVEAVLENYEVKANLFKQLDEYTSADTILASNTSSISITKIAANTKKPDKVIGMHFMNPVPVMKLVEVIRGYATSNATTQIVVEVSKKMEKVPVEVKDYPGFVSNRVLLPMINEAIYCVYEGIATPEAIDEVMKLGMGHPMGPLRLADFIGLDICLNIMDVLYEGFRDSKYRACPLLRNMVAAGHLGDKTGKGFYNYEK
ncbi:MAG: 3-hydroxybutyryl-CoA dehydrogenase [Bacteroidia bacterium]|nr:3-hydroxybutyryl-CoA dehydrogenase [Bacteroidia bacterium]